MSQNKTYVLIIMLWFSILTVWAVNNLTTSLNNQRSVNVQGIPVQSEPQQISTIQIDKDTVWMIDANNSNYITVITHDKDGYHRTQSQMDNFIK